MEFPNLPTPAMRIAVLFDLRRSVPNRTNATPLGDWGTARPTLLSNELVAFFD